MLENALRRTGKAFLELDKDGIGTLVDALVREYADANLPGAGVRMQYLIERIARNLKNLLAFLQRDMRQSGFHPVAFKLRIDDRPDPDDPDAPHVPPVELSDEKGHTVRVVGTVDRVDAMTLGSTTYLRVVDYKTGTKKFDLREVYYGLDCQMLMYLFTLEQNGSGLAEQLGGEPGGELRAAGVEYLMADPSPKTQPRPEAEDDAPQDYPMEGLLLDEESIYRAMDTKGTGAYSPLTYLASSGKVSASSRARLADAEKLDRIRDHLDGLLLQMADNLYSGKIAAEPLCPGNSTPCVWCDYRAVCRHADGEGERAALMDGDPFEKAEPDDPKPQKKGGAKHG